MMKNRKIIRKNIKKNINCFQAKTQIINFIIKNHLFFIKKNIVFYLRKKS